MIAATRQRKRRVATTRRISRLLIFFPDVNLHVKRTFHPARRIESGLTAVAPGRNPTGFVAVADSFGFG